MKSLTAKMQCHDCGKEFSAMGLGTHRWRVHGAGIIFKPSQGHPAWNKGLTKESNAAITAMIDTRKRRVESGELTLIGHLHSDSTKEKLRSSAMKRIAEGRGTFRYGHSKKHEYAGEFFDSGWERSFAVWCDDHQIKWERCKDSFEYSWKESIHSYMPDFWMPDAQCYVEIKGMIRDRDRANGQDLIDQKFSSS